MEALPSEFYKAALGLIHHNSLGHKDLANRIQSLLSERLFIGEEVSFKSGAGKEVGTIVSLFRETSPSNKENQLKYNVETSSKSVEVLPIDKLNRKEPVSETDVFAFVDRVAQKSSSGTWTVREEYLKKYNIKDKVHPFFTAMNGTSKHPASDTPTSSEPKKQRLENGVEPAKNESSSDDEEVVVARVRKSGMGLAPHSSASKKSVAKKVTPKKPVKTVETKKKSPSKTSSKRKVSSTLNGSQTSKSKTSPKKGDKLESSKSKSKASKKQSNLSEFFSTPGKPAKSQDGKSPAMTTEERMQQRATNTSRQVIKHIVSMDLASLNKVLEAAARALPVKYADEIPNEFVRYLYHKSLLKQEQKGKDATERAKLRSDNKELQRLNEFNWLHKKLLSGKFEDTWTDTLTELPELPLIERNQILLFKCIRLNVFLQSYRQMLEIRKVPTLFDFMDALERGNEGFWKTTGPILTAITDFIRKHQRAIPHFTSGYLNYQIKHITIRSVHDIARKILNHDYKPNATIDEDDKSSVTSEESEKSDRLNSTNDHDNAEESGDLNGELNGELTRELNGDLNGRENGIKKAKVIKEDDDEEMETEEIEDEQSEDEGETQINAQTKEDDELCDRFCHHELFELSPIDQARIFELLIERVEASGPVRDSMRNTDGEVKKLKDSLAAKQVKIDKLNKELEELPPMIAEEDYALYTRAQTIGVVKQNQKRHVIEEKREKFEVEISELQEAIEEMRGCSRFRASPLGCDRFHRRYWFFAPSPGLFVEQGAWTSETPDPEWPLALPIKKTPSYTMSTEQLVTFMHTLVNGGYPSTKAPIKWFHVNSQSLFDKLISSLNPKGVRETHLKEAIQKSRAVVEASFNKIN